MRHVEFLSVYVNPWASLDHMGRPSGAVARERTATEPSDHPGYVGAECVSGPVQKLPEGHRGTPDQDTCWQFSADPQKVEATAYYFSSIRQGSLIPADANAARRAGVALVPVKTAHKAAKAKAQDSWRAAFGGDPPDVDPFIRPQPIG
jgi:hypothetical protein